MTSASESREGQGASIAAPANTGQAGQARFIDALGYTYANAVDRLCNVREKTSRNANIYHYRKGRWSEAQVRAYWQAFDGVACPCPEPSALFGDCHIAGIKAASDYEAARSIEFIAGVIPSLRPQRSRTSPG